MKNIRVLLIIYLKFLIVGNFSFSQEQSSSIVTFADKEYYLIDSLILEELAQNDIIILDSCMHLFHVAQNDIEKIDALNGICENMMHESWIKYQVLQYNLITNGLKDPQDDSLRINLMKSLASALNNFGYFAQFDENDDFKSLDYYQRSLEIFEKLDDKKGYADVLNNIALVNKYQGNIKIAIEYYHKSLKINEEIENFNGVATQFNNIGLLYLNQGDSDRALEYLNKSLKIRKKIGDKNGIAGTLNNIGSVYNALGDINKELDYNLQSLKIREEIGDKRGIAQSNHNIGIVYSKIPKINIALEYLNKSLILAQEIGYKSLEATSLYSTGTIFFEQGDIQLAKINAQKSLEMGMELGYPFNIKKASKLLSEIFEKQSQGIQALKMHKLYITMRDSLNNEETQRATAQQQAKYEYEKQKVIDDAAHDKLLAVEKEKKEKQQIFTAATAGVLGLVMVFLLFVYNRLKITRKQKIVIEEQKEKVEKQRDVIEHAHKEITDSIDYAKRIQSAILPPPRIVKEYLEDSLIIYTPKDVVAGDFYWMRNQDDKILFAAADCTGHGVPGAMVSVVCNMALNRAVREYGITDPGEILNKTREIVVREFEKSDEEVKDGMDIALCTFEGNTLQYAGAYNPLWIIRNGEIMETKANRWSIGLTRDPKPYTTHSIDLEKGDVIYIFTDGFVDQFGGEKGKKLKVSGLKNLLLSIHDKPMEDQRKFIHDAFFNWMGKLDQVDDVCLIGVRV